ncbi:hypothetical protein EUTSA_v10011049mg [Eutrema salsugineum]|uniref:Uncharacterized protein n=1 Tax=Eutrema salsugineum TaxID=72664 RepID=V4LTY0_EUTSA|nr:hypothetical protein EUTSA_v10011049mg [Eutrema salsugineum]
MRDTITLVIFWGALVAYKESRLVRYWISVHNWIREIRYWKARFEKVQLKVQRNQLYSFGYSSVILGWI